MVVVVVVVVVVDVDDDEDDDDDDDALLMDFSWVLRVLEFYGIWLWFHGLQLPKDPKYVANPYQNVFVDLFGDLECSTQFLHAKSGSKLDAEV